MKVGNGPVVFWRTQITTTTGSGTISTNTHSSELVCGTLVQPDRTRWKRSRVQLCRLSPRWLSVVYNGLKNDFSVPCPNQVPSHALIDNVMWPWDRRLYSRKKLALIRFNHSSDRHSIEITRRNVEQSMKSRETVELSSVKTKSLMFSETGPQGGTLGEGEGRTIEPFTSARAAYLTCLGTGFPRIFAQIYRLPSSNLLLVFQVGWVKADTKAIQAIHEHVITHNPRVSVSHSDHSTWYLHIRNVQVEDRGTYMCQINTDPMKSEDEGTYRVDNAKYNMFEVLKLRDSRTSSTGLRRQTQNETE
ncbi:unnamed protein product, partial [Nesidiocoris tenuis]